MAEGVGGTRDDVMVDVGDYLGGEGACGLRRVRGWLRGKEGEGEAR